MYRQLSSRQIFSRNILLSFVLKSLTYSKILEELSIEKDIFAVLQTRRLSYFGHVRLLVWRKIDSHIHCVSKNMTTFSKVS